MTGCEARQTTLGPRVCAVKLGPGLLEEGDPEFSVATRCKRWFAILVDRKVVVDRDKCLLAV